MSEETESSDSLQLQIKKLNRLISLQEKKIARAEMVTSTREKVTHMLMRERSAHEDSIKRAHDEIAEKNEHIRIMLENAPVGLTIFDENFNFIDCNEAVLKMYGVTKEFYSIFFGSPLHSPEFQPDGTISHDKALDVIKRVMNGEAMRIEWVHCLPDGKQLPVELSMVRIRQGEKFIGLGYIYDMREQKQMIQELINVQEVNERQLALLNAVVKATKIGLWDVEIAANDLFHPNTAFTWSDDFRKMLGYSNETDFPNVFDSWRDRLHPDEKEKVVRDVVNHISKKTSDKPYDEEYRLMKKEGDYAYFRAYGEVIRDNDGNIIRFAGAFMDITDQKIMQHMLQNIAAKEREANQSKSNFLANMSHEMRTPMNAIIGMTVIGKKAKNIEQKTLALNKIGDASSHLLGVINDVLDMAKIEANKLELSPIEYNFERMLQKVLTVVNFRVEEKKQRLTLNVDKNVPGFMIGDEQRLAQIITNLLFNAVKFTPEGGEIRLDASLVNEIDGNCELRIEVIDSGIGISDEQKEKLFLAFEQAETGISRQYGGTGLGLSISKRIIELMGGNIWVESELGKGARFIFTVKMLMPSMVIDCVNERLDIADDINDIEVITADEFKGKKLLIVEDVEINREIVMALLEDTGLIIDCAENGDEALKKVEAAPDKYDIVFMDVHMPVMNGLESTRCIRALPARKRDGRLPIIAMTANVFKSNIEDCLAAGMDDHLGKPLDIEKVMEKLREYLK